MLAQNRMPALYHILALYHVLALYRMLAFYHIPAFRPMWAAAFELASGRPPRRR